MHYDRPRVERIFCQFTRLKLRSRQHTANGQDKDVSFTTTTIMIIIISDICENPTIPKVLYRKSSVSTVQNKSSSASFGNLSSPKGIENISSRIIIIIFTLGSKDPEG